MTINEAIRILSNKKIDAQVDIEDDDYADVIFHQDGIDALVYAIEALKFQKEYEAKVQALQEENKKLYNQMMENEKDYQRELERLNEKFNELIDICILQQENYEAKVQKCIERLKTQIIVDCEKCELDDEISACVEDSHNRDLEIIKEELGIN